LPAQLQRRHVGAIGAIGLTRPSGALYAGRPPGGFMKVQVETLSPIGRKLSIEVEPAVVASELDRAYKALAKQVKVPGFRPGKAPRRILEQRFRRQIEDEVAERVIQRAWLEAVEQEKVPAVGSPSVIPG